MQLLCAVLVAFVAIKYSICANILGVIPVPSHSHQVVFWPLWKELSQRGHKVTVITSDPMNNPSLENLTEVDLRSAYQFMNLNFFQLQEEPAWKGLFTFGEFFSNLLEHIISNDKVQQLIRDKTTHFDVVMVEAFHTSALAFASRFNCPLILLSSLDGTSYAYGEIGNPAHPILHPDYALPFYNDLTFTQRIESAWSTLRIKFLQKYFYLPSQQKLVEKYFGPDYPPIEDIFKNYSMFL
ncbi:hypothetical protein RI129_000385 [Pyrocoelia pectoralis]|uniref:Uncharacterized protein n=1 Tax=Pyrocoelia pectoralis TaxID=417401 RepID=A0AAN7ZVQ4_9COLE